MKTEFEPKWEILGTENGRTRCLAKTEDGTKWALVELRDEGWVQIGRAVDVPLARDTAFAVLQGKQAAISWPDTPFVLAIAFASLLSLLDVDFGGATEIRTSSVPPDPSGGAPPASRPSPSAAPADERRE